MGKQYLGSRVTKNVIRDIDLLKPYYPNKNAIVEEALEHGLRFLKKNNLPK